MISKLRKGRLAMQYKYMIVFQFLFVLIVRLYILYYVYDGKNDDLLTSYL